MSHLELVRFRDALSKYGNIKTVQGRTLNVSILPVGDDAPDHALINPHWIHISICHDGFADMPAWITPTVERLLESHSLPFTLAFDVESEDACTLLGRVLWIDGQLIIEPIREAGE